MIGKILIKYIGFQIVYLEYDLRLPQQGHDQVHLKVDSQIKPLALYNPCLTVSVVAVSESEVS